MSLLPEEHREKRIVRPDLEASTADLQRQWEDILAINWWPIFHVARETLAATPGSPASRDAIGVLIHTAREIVESGMIRRHDVAGRVFHRLLDERKFLATNYTTIPAAILLAGLAFESGPRWSEIDFASAESVAGLRIVDPACGTGTLLMAAAQEVLKRARRAGAPADQAPTIVRTILEEALYGFDVVPAAIHLAASTLCMAEGASGRQGHESLARAARRDRRRRAPWKPRLLVHVTQPRKRGSAWPLRREAIDPSRDRHGRGGG